MKLNPLFVGLLLLTVPGAAMAGGNSSIVEIDRVDEIRIEKEKITLVGNALVRARVITTAGDHADSSVFGQPAQVVRAKVTKGVFEVIPYFGRDDIEGVPTGGHSSEELKALSDKWWIGTMAKAKTIERGDAVTIGYQGDKTTFTGFQLKRIEGFGTLSIEKKVDNFGLNPKPEAIRDAFMKRFMEKPLEWQDGELPEEMWPELFTKLKPKRVYSDRVNVAIAMKRVEGMESGYYVYIPISSYVPTNGGGWSFEELAPDIWKYTRKVEG